MRRFVLLSFLLGNAFVPPASGQWDYPLCHTDTAIHFAQHDALFARVFIPSHPVGKEQFFNTWTPGSIRLTHGTSVEGVMLSYNALRDELFWLRAGDFKTGVVAKESILEFTLHPTSTSPAIVFRRVWMPGLFPGYTFLQVLSDGDLALYCHRRVEYSPGTRTFARVQAYYLYRNGHMTRIRMGWMGLVGAFPKHERPMVRRIIRTHRLRVSQEADMARAVYLINAELGQ